MFGVQCSEFIEWLLRKTRMKLDFVVKDGSHGAHNIGYVIEILDKVAEETEMGQSLIE